MVEVLLKDLTKKYMDKVVVDNINLHITDKEFMVLYGLAGCGKTTTLRIIAGLEKPTSGRIYIGGKDVTDLPPKDRNIGVVFENLALYPHMTVRQHLVFPLRKKQLSNAEINRKVKEIAELIGLSHRLDHFPGMLSGGEKQRLAIGRAIIKDPEVLLMDEPLKNLDALLRERMRMELKSLQRQLGLTVICATMDDREAMSMGDRIAIMENGKILQIGSADEIYNRPEVISVGKIIGLPRMNFILGKLLREQGKYCLKINDHRLFLHSFECEEELKKKINDQIIIGFRATDIVLANSPEVGSIECNLVLSEDIGGQKVGYVDFNNEIIRVLLNYDVAPSKKVWIKIINVFLYDSDSGKILTRARVT